jgi:pyrimidine operon attenuation protein/uracil phosphoribosyltransferase
MDKRIILNAAQIQLTIERLCFEIFEQYNSFENVVIIGIQPRGSLFARRLLPILEKLYSTKILYGDLDITFHRDDFKTKSTPTNANITTIDFLTENKNVILIDDVLYTGRTIRAALDALMNFGRPQTVELVTLIDRRFNRELPIQADYIGKVVDTVEDLDVAIEWGENTNAFFTNKQS